LTEEDVVNDVHCAEVMWGKAPSMCDGEVKMNTPMFVTAGDYICTVSGKGATVTDAREKCYSTIKKKIEIPNSIMYRTDIGCRLEKQLDVLHEFGYATDCDWE